MNNLATRSLTGAFFVIIMIGAAVLGQLATAVLFAGITYIGLSEFFKLVSTSERQPPALAAMLAGMAVYLLLALNALSLVPYQALLAIPLILFVLMFAELWRSKPDPFVNIALGITGIVYVAVPSGMLLYLFDNRFAAGINHYIILVGYLFILWLNDTGAYFTGSLIGKHKLFERHSPGKTWEGSTGGAVFALLTAWLFSSISNSLSLSQWLIMAAIVIVTGSLGDLVESMLKRSRGVKDSGTLMPGHGGILDRFDAVLLSVPFVFVYLALFCR